MTAAPETRRRIGVGNEDLVDALGATCPPALRDQAAEHRRRGQTVLFLVVDDSVSGLITLQEQIRESAGPALHTLRAGASHLSVLTGDREAAGQRVASHLDLSVTANCSPDEKVDRLAALRERHDAVALIGDGINDAAVLAAADVGVAMSSGASVSLEAADITLYNPDLQLIPWLHRLSNRLSRIIRQNLVWTFGYNAIGLGLAVFGLLHPLVAVAIMTVSSLIVTWNAFRVRSLPAPSDLASS
jgi:P-type E1-E2 ATPase